MAGRPFFEECDDVDDETLYEMAVLLGVMMGVGSANSMLTVIAKNAQEAVAKKVARQSPVTPPAGQHIQQ